MTQTDRDRYVYDTGCDDRNRDPRYRDDRNRDPRYRDDRNRDPRKEETKKPTEVKSSAWGYLLRGLVVSGILFFIFTNIPLLLKIGIYLVAVAAINPKESKKLLRIGYVVGVCVLVFLLEKFLGNIPLLGEALKALPELAWFWIPMVYHLLLDARAGLFNKSGRKHPVTMAEVMITIACVLVCVVLAVLASLNAKPWIELSETIVKVLLQGAFGLILQSSPLGDLIRFLPFIIGTSFWAFCQFIQILPIVLVNDPVLGERLKRSAQKNEFVRNALKNLGAIRVGAYIFETLVCLAAMPPYEGGWVMIWRDMGNWDADRIHWHILLFIIPLTIVGMEVIVKVALSLFALRKAAVEA